MRIHTAKAAFAVAALLATFAIDIPAGPAAASARTDTRTDSVRTDSTRTDSTRADSTRAPSGCVPTWKLMPTPTPPGSTTELTSVTALSPTDVWTGGSVTFPIQENWILHGNGSSFVPAAQVPTEMAPIDVSATSFSSDTEGWGLAQIGGSVAAEHWHGGRWTLTPLPVPADPATTGIYLHSVATVSAMNAWGVGGIYQVGVGVISGTVALGSIIEHWDGTTWTTVPNPAADKPGAMLASITVRSATDIWAVGRQGAGADGIVPLIEHWDGASWSVSTAPTGNQLAALFSVSATGQNDAWAVGDQTAATGTEAVPLLEHWDGAWTEVTGLPDLGNARLDTVYAAGPSSVWAIVETPDGANQFLHWDGSVWSTVTMPGPQELGLRYFYIGLDGTGPNDIWAVGVVTDFSTGISTPQVAHLSCGKV